MPKRSKSKKYTHIKKSKTRKICEPPAANFVEQKALDPSIANIENISPRHNPNFRKIVRGNFNQGSTIFKDDSRGNQCTANAAVALAFCVMECATLWITDTIDRILKCGDKYYNKCMETRRRPGRTNHGNLHHLTVTELCQDLRVENRNLNVRVLEQHAIDGHLTIERGEEFPNFLRGLQRFFAVNSSGIITSNGLSVAVFRQNDCYCYFDSHSRDALGSSTSDGTACLMIFDTILQMHSAILTNLYVNFAADENYVNIYALTPIVVTDSNVPMVNLPRPLPTPAPITTTTTTTTTTILPLSLSLTKPSVVRGNQYGAKTTKTSAAAGIVTNKTPTTTTRTRSTSRRTSIPKALEEPFRHLTIEETSKPQTSRPIIVYANEKFKTAATTDVEENYCDTMKLTCKYCGAIFFIQEFFKCCRNGLIDLPLAVDNNSYPQLLFRLLTDQHEDSKNFKANIMRYNNNFAFASIGANVNVPTGYGPSMYLITGLIYHKISDIDLSNAHPRYGQLYFLDSEEAKNQRLNHERNQATTLKATLIDEIDALLRRINPFAKLYHFLKEVEREEREKMEREGNAFPNISVKIHEENVIDRRRYNAPTTNDEVGVVFRGSDGGDPPAPGELRLSLKTAPSTFIKIRRESPIADPLCYPLLFPAGELGWETNLQLNPSKFTAHNLTRRRISMNEFVVYRALSIRNGVFNPILSAAKLTQQYLVDSYVRIEGERLNFIKSNQKGLRCDQYSGLLDFLNNVAERQESKIGRVVILPSSFVGSPRAMQQHYQDAMTIVTKYGRPDLFITFTCNPKWREIVENIEKFDKVENRCDMICRVFHMKFKILLDDVWNHKIFGQPLAYVYVIEFQKRGLPHAHMLLTLTGENKFREPEDIDKFISAEIPDAARDPTLYEYVTRHMIHGPCGTLNPTCVCMEDGKCKKNFPKAFVDNTTTDTYNYPMYRRRDTSQCVTITRGAGKGRTYDVDNRFVVPHNPYLLKKFNAHINVEICTSVKSIKYIMKYIHKGHDCAVLKMNVFGNSDYDETEEYVDSRYVGASEACWRLLDYPMHGTSHTVIRLPIHLPGQQTIYFTDREENVAVERSANKKSMLEAWFELNARDAAANVYLYTEIPHHYRFETKTCKWMPRIRNVKGERIITRMYTITPRYVELFHMRILLLHTKGARSYEDLKIVNGVTMSSFKATVEAMNLIESDNEWMNCLREASEKQMPSQMRKLFAYILSFCSVSNPLTLWNTYKKFLIEDFTRKGISTSNSERKTLIIVAKILASVGKSYAEIGLPAIEELPEGREDEQENQDVLLERDAARESANRNVVLLNPEQMTVFDKVMTAIFDDNEPCRLFYVDGPGGTGKTFVYNTILDAMYGADVEFASVAWTGIAAILLRGGRTVHSKFRLPINLKSTSTSSISAQSKEAETLRRVKLIVWDEITMATVHAFDLVNRLFKDLCNNDRPFGGKVVLVGGDFRQCLPVVPRGHRTTIMEACVTNSNMWSRFENIRLKVNMRASNDEVEFARWLLDLGDGKLSVDPAAEGDLLPQDTIAIPSQCVVDDVVTAVYGTIEDYTEEDVEKFTSRAILSPKNDSCNNINNSVVERFPGETTIYYSIDKIATDDEQERANFTLEYLNSITPSGLPNHELRLKKNIPVMLLRNLDIDAGLCNGTRLIVKTLSANLIECEIAVGQAKGKKILIPRMDLSSNDTSIPFDLMRRQFPLKVCFAMTINKAQGQTFDHVGIYLPGPVFAHGQLYVAFSRARSFSSVHIQVTNTPRQGKLLRNDSRTFTKNIVYKNALTHNT